MELKEIIRLVSKNKRILGIAGATGIILAVVINYFVPLKWTASQTFFIEEKSVNETSGYFNYDSYYANQVGISYTNSLSGLFDSRDLKIQILKSLGQPVSEKSILDLNKNLRAKKLGPQTIQVSYQNFDKSKAEKTLQESVNATLNVLQNSNKDTGIEIILTKVAPESVAVQNYLNPYLVVVVGFGIMEVLAFLYLVMKRYLEQ